MYNNINFNYMDVNYMDVNKQHNAITVIMQANLCQPQEKRR